MIGNSKISKTQKSSALYLCLTRPAQIQHLGGREPNKNVRTMKQHSLEVKPKEWPELSVVVSKCGAGRGNRTPMVLPPRDFESRASTDSAIPASSPSPFDRVGTRGKL